MIPGRHLYPITPQLGSILNFEILCTVIRILEYRRTVGSGADHLTSHALPDIRTSDSGQPGPIYRIRPVLKDNPFHSPEIAKGFGHRHSHLRLPRAKPVIWWSLSSDVSVPYITYPDKSHSPYCCKSHKTDP